MIYGFQPSDIALRQLKTDCVGRWLAAAEEINEYMILKNAYNEKEQLRFATISVQSPKEYDLKVK